MAKRHRIIVSKEFVHRKLIFRLRMFAVLFAAMAALIIYDVSENIIEVPLAIAGIALGLVVGFTVGYLANIIWHPETNKVMTRIDRAGIVILVLYLSFSFSRKWLFGHWIHGPALTAFCFSIASGVTLGRLLSMRFQIRQILKEQGHLKR